MCSGRKRLTCLLHAEILNKMRRLNFWDISIGNLESRNQMLTVCESNILGQADRRRVRAKRKGALGTKRRTRR